MADNQEFVREQRRIIKRIGDAPERSIGLGPNHRRVLIELNLDGKPWQLEQLRSDGRPLQRHAIGLGLNSLQHLLPQGRELQIGRGIKADKLTDPVFRRGTRLGPSRGQRCHGANQQDDEQTNAMPAFLPQSHQRYPASPMAWLHRALTPRVAVKMHSRAWPPSLGMPPHILATAERAATRFWIASKART